MEEGGAGPVPPVHQWPAPRPGWPGACGGAAVSEEGWEPEHLAKPRLWMLPVMGQEEAQPRNSSHAEPLSTAQARLLRITAQKASTFLPRFMLVSLSLAAFCLPSASCPHSLLCPPGSPACLSPRPPRPRLALFHPCSHLLPPSFLCTRTGLRHGPGPAPLSPAKAPGPTPGTGAVRSGPGQDPPNFPSAGAVSSFHGAEFQVRMALPLLVPGAAGNLFIAGAGM